jgi:hypothetical protein
MFRLALLLMLVMTVSPSVQAAPDAVELEGTVSLSPARPGPQHAGERDTTAMVKAIVRVLQVDGHEVARTTTDDQGHFKVAVAPGAYKIAVDVQRAVFPRCQAVDVIVHEGVRNDVQVMCDSGMR